MCIIKIPVPGLSPIEFPLMSMPAQEHVILHSKVYNQTEPKEQ